jgi:hypothetical protein
VADPAFERRDFAGGGRSGRRDGYEALREAPADLVSQSDEELDVGVPKRGLFHRPDELSGPNLTQFVLTGRIRRLITRAMKVQAVTMKRNIISAVRVRTLMWP